MVVALIIVAVIVALYLFLTFPSIRRHSDRNLLKGMYIAHRGLHSINSKIPENSLPAFRAAVNAGYAIENDIHITRDGEVVVFHDDNLMRMCGIDKNIEDLTLDEIKGLKLKGTNCKIPTLKECLNTVGGKVPILIEFKANFKTYKNLCKKADEILKNYKGKYFIQSFFPPVLGWYKKHRSDICRGQLASGFFGDKFYKKIAGCLIFNFVSRPDFISYEHTYKNHISRRICVALGALSVGWTFKNQSEIDKEHDEFLTYIFETFIP